MEVRKFIRKIFESNMYQIEKEQDAVKYFIGTGKKRDYFICYFIDVNDKIDKTIGEVIKIFEKYKNEKDNAGEIDKNTSLVLFIKTDDVKSFYEDKNLQNQLFEIEESTYYFKRYVLVYKEDDELLNFIENNSIDKIEDEVKDKQLFENYSKNLYDNNLYNFLISLYIKIPFLNIKKEENTFQSIDIKFENELKAKNIYEFYLKTKAINLDKENSNELEELDKFLKIFEGGKDDN